MNFFQNIASFGSSPFRKEEKDSKTQLEELGVNTQEIDTQVQQEAANVEATTFGEQEFFGDVNTIMSDNELDYDTAFDETLKYYKSKNYTIEGVDIDAELGLSQPVQVSNINNEQTTTKEPETAIGALLEGSTDKALESLESFKEGTENVIGGAIAQAPAVVSNTASFILDMVQNDSALNSLSPFKFGLDKMDEFAKEKGLPTLAEHLKNDGLDTKESIQENLGVDPEAFTTKAGEFGTEIAATAVGPGGVGLIDDAIKNSPKLIQLAKESPKLFSYLKAAIVGGTETAKFGVVSEGEVTPTGVAVGVVANPVFKGIGSLAQKINPFSAKPEQLLREITGASKKQIADLGIKTLQEDAKIGVEAIRILGAKPGVRADIYTAFKTRMRDIYTKHINPRLKEAGAKGEIKVEGLTDDVLDKISENIGGKRIYKGFTPDEVFQKEIKGFNKVLENVKTFEDLEKLKLITGANAKATGMNDGLKSFYGEVNKQIQTKMDNLLEGAGFSGVTKLKREYAGLSNLNSTLDTKVAQELRNSGNDIVSQFGAFSTLNQLGKGDIAGAISTGITTATLSKLRDPNTIISKMTKQIYGEKTYKQLLLEIGKNKAIGATSSELGTAADKEQREKVGLE